MVALVAPSGAGKSTLLHTAGLLERPDAGDVILAGRACGRLSDDERTAIRRNDIGFVYQFHHLLPEFSALENIMMPQLIKGLPRAEAASRRRAAARLHADRQARRTTGRPNCRAASSSAWRSPAPSPMRRWCCWPTSRPATSIPITASYVFEALAALVPAVRPRGADRHAQSRACRGAWTAASRWRTARSSRSRRRSPVRINAPDTPVTFPLPSPSRVVRSAAIGVLTFE